MAARVRPWDLGERRWKGRAGDTLVQNDHQHQGGAHGWDIPSSHGDVSLGQLVGNKAESRNLYSKRRIISLEVGKCRASQVGNKDME